MNRLFTRIPAALTALAFWRKPAAAQAETPLPATLAAHDDGQELIGATEPEAAARSSATPDASANGAEAAGLEPAPPPFVARLIAKLRRPKAESADGASPGAGDEADAAEPPPRRGIAMLSRRIVWIPATGFALLAVVGTLAALLWQSDREQAALEAKLKAIEQELERAAPAAVPKAAVDTAPPTKAAPQAGTAPSPPLTVAGGDCDLSDLESVSVRLKDCIDAFNDATARSRPPRPPSTTR